MSSKSLNIILGILILILVGATIFFYLTRKSIKTVNNSESAVQTELIKNTVANNQQPSTIIKDETADWKSYGDKSLGLEFKYPENFNVLNGLQKALNAIFVSDEKIKASDDYAPIWIGPTHELINAVTINSKSLQNKNTKTIIVDGKEAEVVKGTQLTKDGYYKIILAIFKEPKITVRAQISFIEGSTATSYVEKMEKVVDQIISTLKFTK